MIQLQSWSLITLPIPPPYKKNHIPIDLTIALQLSFHFLDLKAAKKISMKVPIHIRLAPTTTKFFQAQHSPINPGQGGIGRQ